MISVRDIIVEANRICGVIQDGEELDGVKTAVGEELLNELVANMNVQNFFASQQVIVRARGNGKLEMTIGPHQYDEDGNELPPDQQPDIEAERPQNILELYAGTQQELMSGRLTQVALYDIPLFQVNFGAGFPARFAYQSSYPLGKIVFDIPLSKSFTLAICYCKSFDEFHVNDELEIPREYQPALTWMLAELLCARYMLPTDVTARVKDFRDRFVNAIKRNYHRKTPVHAYVNDAFGGTILNRY